MQKILIAIRVFSNSFFSLSFYLWSGSHINGIQSVCSKTDTATMFFIKCWVTFVHVIKSILDHQKSTCYIIKKREHKSFIQKKKLDYGFPSTSLHGLCISMSCRYLPIFSIGILHIFCLIDLYFRACMENAHLFLLKKFNDIVRIYSICVRCLDK